jgi:hypothetical protein
MLRLQLCEDRPAAFESQLSTDCELRLRHVDVAPLQCEELTSAQTHHEAQLECGGEAMVLDRCQEALGFVECPAHLVVAAITPWRLCERHGVPCETPSLSGLFERH